TAAVGAGAELLADGCIHVYDPLRGRALAGISGDRGARIFCRRLEAELVSVAGMYRVAEDIAQTA
ncbi:MAG: septum site-determining protein MinC, partial [Alphaproteobacteria bacterium]|nr:septum site-determining protein MinC [Alphaproteobacteria bacterium]